MLIGGTCAVLLLAVYLLAVWTPAGQRFEDAVLRAAEATSGTTEGVRATDALDRLTAPSVIGAALVVLAIGLLRRRVILGILGVGVVLASIATVQIMRRTALRPILLHSGTRREDQSFPSGHAAVAIAVMCALVLVTPYRFRGVVLFLTSLWAAGVTVDTITASWHRPSDTIGAGLVAVFWTAVAVAVLAWRGRLSEAALQTATGRRARGLLAAGYGAVALLGFTVGVIVAGAGSRAVGGPALTAGRAVALAASTAVAVTLLALLRHVDLGAPPSDRAEGRQPA